MISAEEIREAQTQRQKEQQDRINYLNSPQGILDGINELLEKAKQHNYDCIHYAYKNITRDILDTLWGQGYLLYMDKHVMHDVYGVGTGPSNKYHLVVAWNPIEEKYHPGMRLIPNVTQFPRCSEGDIIEYPELFYDILKHKWG